MNGLFFLLAAAALAALEPQPLDVLRKSLEPSVASYDGRMILETFPQTGAAAKQMRVRFLNPGHYRRELLDASGKPLQIIVSDGKSEWVYDKTQNKVWQGQAPDGDYKQFGWEQEYDLLTANYDVRMASSPPVARRRAWALELLSRRDGKIQRRIWVDKKNGLILQSRIFQSDGRLVSTARFASIQFPKKQDPALFRFEPPEGATVVKRLEPDYLALDQAKSASGLEPKLPLWLPSGYVFESLNVLAQGGKKVIHYRFSDGINVLSLFQCPARTRLNFGAKASRRFRLASGPATLAWTSEGHVLGWSSQGSKFVLISPLDSSTLRHVAESLP